METGTPAALPGALATILSSSDNRLALGSANRQSRARMVLVFHVVGRFYLIRNVPRVLGNYDDRQQGGRLGSFRGQCKLPAPQQKEPIIETSAFASTTREPWNKGKLVGHKTPFKLKEIWAIRVRLQIASRCRDLALFNLAINSKLRACDLMLLRVRDVCHGQTMASRALVLQQKTRRPVQFEITDPTRDAVLAWITFSGLKSEDCFVPDSNTCSPHLSTRQYARIVDSRVLQLGVDSTSYGTHTLRRTKATLIYRRSKNLRAIQLLLGHTKLERTVRYLGIEVHDALELAEQTEA
jgi:integrase